MCFSARQKKETSKEMRKTFHFKLFDPSQLFRALDMPQL